MTEYTIYKYHVPVKIWSDTTSSRKERQVAPVTTSASDQQASLFNDIRQSLFNAAYRITADKEQANDIVQDVYTDHLMSPDKFSGTSSLKTYLYRIVINRCIDLKRRQNRFRKISDFLTGEPRTHRRPDDVYAIKDLVRRVLADIDEKYRVPFVLAESDDMPYEEIASVLLININTVRSRIYRCRNLLRKKLQTLGYPL